MQVVPTDFARYRPNGTGRDSYIHTNNGGLGQWGPKYTHSLRDGLHKPSEQVSILLPSYHAAKSREAVMAARAAQRDPVKKTQAQKQKDVTQYLHTTRSTRSPTSRSNKQQTMTATGVEYVAIPCMPPVVYVPASFTRSGTLPTVQLPGIVAQRNPYQQPMARTWDGATALPSVSAPHSSSLPVVNDDAAYLDAPYPEKSASLPQTLDEQVQAYEQTSSQPLSPASPAALARTVGLSRFEKPSFFTTLPKNSGYLDSAQSYTPPRDINQMPAAGFSISQKLLAKGIDEHAYPLLA